jgi:hypothetical protein
MGLPPVSEGAVNDTVPVVVLSDKVAKTAVGAEGTVATNTLLLAELTGPGPSTL